MQCHTIDCAEIPQKWAMDVVGYLFVGIQNPPS